MDENLPEFKVLIVDDEPFNIEYLKQELEEYHYTILSALDGKQATEIIHSDNPDIILLDIMMPAMDGFDVLKEIKAQVMSRESDVIIISALDDISNVAKGLELGAEDYLSKPFNPVILHSRINAVVEKKRLRNIKKKYLTSLEREMEIGREIQAGFLPKEIPQDPGWDIAVIFRPAKNVAGDFYDIFKLSNNLIAIISGDVCDKGIGAALFMSLYRSMIHAFSLSEYSKQKDTNNDLSILASHIIINTLTSTTSYICDVHEEALFSSLFFGLLHTDTGVLFYANAGHEPPIFRSSRNIDKKLLPTGPVLGFEKESKYLINNIHFGQGDFLLIYSDGILDAQSSEGAQFREDFTNPIPFMINSSQSLLDDIIQNLDGFTAGEPQFDDITLIGVHRK